MSEISYLRQHKYGMPIFVEMDVRFVFVNLFSDDRSSFIYQKENEETGEKESESAFIVLSYI